MNKHFETTFYELYEEKHNKVEEAIYEFQPKNNENIIRFVVLENKSKFPIIKEDRSHTIGLVTYNNNRPLSLAN